jgi:HSP20 family protein
MGKNNQVALTRKASTALMRKPESFERLVTPVADVYETSDAFIVKLDLPGATKESIDLTITENRLSVKSVVQLGEGENARLVFGEIRPKTYYREFAITEGINYKSAEASFDAGVLTITLPKSETMKAKEIPIK